MTPASHAGDPEFDSRSSYTYNDALLVQWLEFIVANDEARVRFPDSALYMPFFFAYGIGESNPCLPDESQLSVN